MQSRLGIANYVLPGTLIEHMLPQLLHFHSVLIDMLEMRLMQKSALAKSVSNSMNEPSSRSVRDQRSVRQCGVRWEIS